MQEYEDIFRKLGWYVHIYDSQAKKNNWVILKSLNIYKLTYVELEL